MALTGKQRTYLRSLAHHLEPVVQVGHAGLSDAVMAQIDGALQTHELIKVKLGKECPVPREDAPALVEGATSSTVVQVIGKTLVVYRRRKKDPKIVLPKGKGAKG